jgi:protein TonB
MLLQRVKPQYPPAARIARIEGSVVLQAVIGKEGEIENLHVISGHPLLAPAALDAVRRWRYRPYFLNGEPVEVETKIVVNFLLSND